jgi:hypothetical protein
MERWIYRVNKGEIAKMRKETYKSFSAYERAFYKFICKQGWYSPMRNGFRKPKMKNDGGYWGYGYPCFRDYRSDAYKAFNNAGMRGIDSGYTKLRSEEEMERRRQEEFNDKCRNIRRAEYQTGWSHVHACHQLGVDVMLSEESPLELIEAKQFQMGIQTLINAAKKAKRTHAK